MTGALLQNARDFVEFFSNPISSVIERPVPYSPAAALLMLRPGDILLVVWVREASVHAGRGNAILRAILDIMLAL